MWRIEGPGGSRMKAGPVSISAGQTRPLEVLFFSAGRLGRVTLTSSLTILFTEAGPSWKGRPKTVARLPLGSGRGLLIEEAGRRRGLRVRRVRQLSSTLHR